MSGPSVTSKGLSFCFSWHSHEHLFKIKHSWELQKLLSWKRCPKSLFLCFHVKPRSSGTFSFGDWNHSNLLAESTGDLLYWQYLAHSSVLAWRIPGTGEPGELQSMGSHSQTRLKRLSSSSRPPCPLPTPRVHSNSCPSSRWCHPGISSSVVPLILYQMFLS